MLAPSGTAIRVLRCGGLNADAAQPFERAMSRLDLRPTCLPPAAILCVRYLQAPRGRLMVRGGDARFADDWDRRVRDELDLLARGAARPARGPVPSTAIAVVFADRAELLACLAADWLGNNVSGRWWWQGLLRGADAAFAVKRELLEVPECVPAAIEILDRRGHATALARALDEVAPALLQRVIQVFALEYLVELPALATLAERPLHISRPWQAWAPEAASAGLPPHAEMLVAISLGIVRAPSAIRSAAFAHRVRTWLAPLATIVPGSSPPIAFASPDVASAVHAVELAASSPSPPRAALLSAARPPAIAVPLPAVHVETGHEIAPDASPDEARAVLEQQRPPAAPIRQVTADVSLRDASVDSSVPEASPVTELASFVKPVAHSPALTLPGASGDAPFAAPAQPLPPTIVEPDEAIRTDQGGVLFLINVAIDLGLYSDFTNPARTGLSLSIWDWLALVGDAILGGALRDDPLWVLLAQRANRAPDKPPKGSARWTRRMVRQVRLRLEQGLAPQPPDTVETLLGGLQATLYPSATRLDAFFLLDQLPIEIRRCGLDRDPGWVPAAGCFIGFHFD